MMATVAVTVSTLLIFLVPKLFAAVPEFPPMNNEETFRNLIRTKRHLIIGSSGALYRINPSNLTMEEKRLLLAPSRLLVADTDGSYRGNFLSCSNAQCFLAEIVNFANISWQVNNSAVIRNVGTQNVAGVFAPSSNGTTELTFGEAATTESSRRFVKGGLLNVDFSSSAVNAKNFAFSRIAAHTDTTSSSLTFNYHTQFSYNGLIYFVTDPVGSESSPRVVRFCQNDTGFRDSFRSHFEVRLSCASGVITAATFVNSLPFTQPTILITVREDVAGNRKRMHVCAYSLTDIDRVMSEYYNNCIIGAANTFVGFSRGSTDRCMRLTDRQLENIRECNLIASLTRGLEVMDSVQGQVITAYTPTRADEHFTSLTTSVLQDSLSLFAGSSRSSLYQFNIGSSSTSAFIRQISLNESTIVTNVTHVLSSADGEHIYAMTQNKLHLHTVDQCHQFTSCTSCLTSNDPICGWCALTNVCVRESSCSTINDDRGVSRRIFTNDSVRCPTIVSSTPSIIHLEQLQGGNSIDITLETSNILSDPAARDFTYQCVYSFQSVTTTHPDFTTPANKGANPSSNAFTCSSPGLPNVPPLPPQTDTVNVLVSVRNTRTGRNFATSQTPIQFTDCSIHTSCGSCISSGANKCRWCALSFTCISDLQSSNCPRLNEISVRSGGVCNINILPHPNNTDYLIHSGYTYPSTPLLILSEGLHLFTNGIFTCHICETSSCSNMVANVSAQLDVATNTVSCNLNRLEYTLSRDRPSANLTLQVLVNNSRIDNPNNTQVLVYGCPYMGTNCAQCLSLDNKFGCDYCGMQVRNPGSCLLTAGSTGMCNTMRIFNAIRDCDAPSVTDFSPKDGPTPGGTKITIRGHNLGVIESDIGRISIGGVECTRTSYSPGVGITCTTGSMDVSLVTAAIRIDLNFQSESIESSDNFSYKAPSLHTPPASPREGPTSGGTNITVSGSDIGIGSRHKVLIGQKVCEVLEVKNDSILCRTSPSETPSLNNLLRVEIDNWSSQRNGYNYVQDPTFQGISPSLSFREGGTNFTVTGDNLNVVQKPRLLLYVTPDSSRRRRRQTDNPVQMRLESKPCTVMSNSMMYCMAPSVSGTSSNSTSAGVGLLMDGVQSLLDLNRTIMIHPNPRIMMFERMVFAQDDQVFLMITGEGFLFNADQVQVLITPCDRECVCSNVRVYPHNNTLLCEVSDQGDLSKDTDLTVMVHVGSFSTSAGVITISTTPNLLVILIPVFAALIIVCVAVFIVLCTVFFRKTRQKDQRYDQLMMELERLESSVARECKLGFAELQTDLDELTGDVAGCRLPYHNLQTFFLATLFPGSKDHPILHRIELPSHKKPQMERAIRDFDDLLNDQKILLLFIQTLEEQRSFTIRDKSTVGSLLIVALHGRLDYATEVLKKLLTQLIRKTVSNSNPKLLLRRTESIAERVLTNWLAFCLQGYIMEHTGQPLYLLYKAVKNQLEKGPVDVITGEARYSLSEQKLIRQKVDVTTINASVESEDGLRVPVKLLDCDTISQVKEKLLDSLFKAAPVSKRPRLTAVDLEYLKSPSETMILRDEDHSTIVEAGWKRINTLRHYWVQEGAMFRIRSRRDHPPPGRVYDYPGSIISTHSPRQRALSEAEDGSRVWHLFKQVDIEDPKRSPFLNNKKMVSEIYLPRMLSTKSILQNFVDELFNALFSITHPPSSPTTMFPAAFPQSPGVQVPMGYAPGADAVPMAIKYIFDFLDDEAENYKILDPDVVHTWKNNALSLRFWVNMIKNPEFVFDINKSHTVDACLSVVAQAFIDGCSSAEIRLNIDSPTSKLLYNKEVQGYKTKVKKYYRDVKQLPRIPEDAMQYYLRQLSEYQQQQMKKTGGFSTDSATRELLRYAMRYYEPFLTNLRNAGLQNRAHQFEGILKLTGSSTQL